jgi:hypothetical protein
MPLEDVLLSVIAPQLGFALIRGVLILHVEPEGSCH